MSDTEKDLEGVGDDQERIKKMAALREDIVKIIHAHHKVDAISLEDIIYTLISAVMELAESGQVPWNETARYVISIMEEFREEEQFRQ